MKKNRCFLEIGKRGKQREATNNELKMYKKALESLTNHFTWQEKNITNFKNYYYYE